MSASTCPYLPTSPRPWQHGADEQPSHRLLSCESPSGALKAVLLKVAGKEKEKEKEKQFLEVSEGPEGYRKEGTGNLGSSCPSAPRCGIRTVR